jgi:hypothetical protein
MATTVLVGSAMFALAGLAQVGVLILRPSNLPTLICLDTRHDFGELTHRTVVSRHTFVFNNPTNRPIQVSAIQVDCMSCMQVDWTERLIQPGEDAMLLASLFPATLRGPVDKRIRVYLDGGCRPLELSLIARIVP